MEMAKKLLIVIVPIIIIIFTVVLFKGYSSSRGVVGQAANLYNATKNENFPTALPKDALTWQELGNGQCIGLNESGQAFIGKTYRRGLSFSKNCSIVETESEAFTRESSEHFWFGSLFGLRCYAVIRDDTGVATDTYWEEGVVDKESCIRK